MFHPQEHTAIFIPVPVTVVTVAAGTYWSAW